jgi:DNA-binding CsgD family transcriptional regulator
LGAVQKVRLHRQVGLTLETLYRSDPEPHLAELAHHFVQAGPGGDVAKAVAYAQRSGERAMALLAFEDAVMHFEQALQALELLDPPNEALRCDLLLALAAAHLNAGDVTTGRKTYVRAAHLAKAAGSPEQLARAALGFGGEPIVAWGFDAELVGVLEDALALLGPEDSSLRSQLLTRLATEHNDVDPERMSSLIEDAEAMARRLGDARALAVALIGLLHVHLARGDESGALVATGRELSGLGEELGDRGVMGSGAIGQLTGHLHSGDVSAADQQIETYARIAEESRQPFYVFWTPTMRTLRALMDGRFADAERHMLDAVALVPRAHLAQWTWWYALNLFAIRREQAELDDATRALRQVIAEVTHPERALTFRAMLALARIETGRSNEARRNLDELVGDHFAAALGEPRRGTHFVHGLGCLTEVCAALGDASLAATLYVLLLPHAGHNLVWGGIFHGLGSASYFLGLLATTLERWDDAARHFADALAMNERMGARPFVARTQLAFATMLVKRDAPGDRDQADALLDAALATANELGMVRLTAEAAAMQTVFEQRRSQSAAVSAARFGLTERELDVLRLLVTGRSNPQIAELLFISPATARTHVSNILAKLDVHTRTEAVDVAHRHGLLLPPGPATT